MPDTTPDGPVFQAPPDAPTGPPLSEPSTSATSDHGFPADTPVADMTIEQQVAYWRFHSRKHQERVREYGGLTPDQVRDMQTEFEQLRQAALSDKDKAIEAAKAEGAELVRRTLTPELVSAEIRVQAAGRLSDEQRSALVEGIDTTVFLTSEGKVDTDKVTAWIDKIAPPKPTDGFPNLGQGRRATSQLSGKEAGAAEAARRFGSTTRS